MIFTRSPSQPVTANTTNKGIIIDTTNQCIVAIFAKQQVITDTTIDDVVPCTAHNNIFATHAHNRIVATKSADDIVAGGATQHLTPKCPFDGTFGGVFGGFDACHGKQQPATHTHTQYRHDHEKSHLCTFFEIITMPKFTPIYTIPNFNTILNYYLISK